jgi:hypothetical protein
MLMMIVSASMGYVTLLRQLRASKSRSGVGDSHEASKPLIESETWNWTLERHEHSESHRLACLAEVSGLSRRALDKLHVANERLIMGEQRLSELGLSEEIA